MRPDRPVRARGLAVAILLLCCSFPATAELPPSASPFLWQVTGDKTTHYLLGSVHLLPKTAGQLPAGIRQAFEAADTLVFESDIARLSDRDSTAAMLDSARAPQGLKSEIDADTLARVRARMVDLKMPSALCESYRPWFCALSLELFTYQRAGFRGEFGLDRQLYEIARRTPRTIAWFEDPSAHLNLFTAMPAPLSRQFLDAALSERNPKADEPVEMYRAWRDNDIERMTAVIAELKREFPAVHDHLLAARNRAWLPELKRRLAAPQRQLFVVGAAHWLGPDGLIAGLEAAGYKVRPYLVIDPAQQAHAATGVLLASH
ncbi:MAG: hypothetical protein C0434_07285 [Xanthomonadaceae bacterium]|nr:hypothetical protein [Xanthomonadaceae bacterium]